MTPSPVRRDHQLRVLDLSSPQRAVRIELDSSPAYELITAITALSHADAWDTYQYGVAWYDGLRAKLSDESRTRLSAADGSIRHTRSWAHLVGLVRSAPRRDDVDAVIEHIAGLPAESVFRTLVEGTLGGSSHPEAAGLVDRLLAGEPAADVPLLAAVCEDSDDDRELLEALVGAGPAQVHEDVVAVMREMREVLRDHLDAVAPALRHDVEERGRRLRGLPLEEAVEVGTAGIHYVPEPWVRRVLLIPQAAMRPWVLIEDHADTKIFMVAVDEECLSLDHERPPARLLAVTKALAEEQRLRILRRLAAGPASLQQITDHLGIAKSTAHHHLVQLRAAGLIVVEMGQEKEYTIREGLVRDLGDLLDTYLRGRGSMTR